MTMKKREPERGWEKEGVYKRKAEKGERKKAVVSSERLYNTAQMRPFDNGCYVC